MPFPKPDLSLICVAAAAVPGIAAPAQAQLPEPSAVVVAIPPLATAKKVDTDAGDTWSIANQMAALISADLKSTSGVMVADLKGARTPSYPEITAPSYPQWRAVGVKLLVSGFVNARPDGRLTIGCYVYDVQNSRELTRQGFAVAPAEWRRAAHRCADAAYVKATGKAPQFDSRIAYVAQSGSGETAVKRLAVMDFDGANHSYVTTGEATVLTPKLSPGANRIAYTSFSGGTPHVQLVDVASGEDRPLGQAGTTSFAPAFSPDGRIIAFSMSLNGNVDLYASPADGGFPQRLTMSPAIDTSPSYSPDGARIAFVSDRSGTPQLYVMDADGSNQRRISFGPGLYGSPAWSPDGERIAFTRSEGPTMRIGSIAPDGSDERILSAGPRDEQPSWSPDSGRILFQREEPATRRALLATVPASGGDARPVPTPQGASDPSWAERQE